MDKSGLRPHRKRGEGAPSRAPNVSPVITEKQRRRMEELGIQEDGLLACMRLLKTSNADDVFAHMERVKAADWKPTYM